MAPFNLHIIDDNPTFLDKAVDYLNSHNEVKSIGWSLSLIESQERILENELDYVLVDYSMPVHNGIESLKFIKSKPNPPKVIILSMNNDNIYKEEAFKAGADGFITKGDFVIEMEKLLAK